LSVIEVGEKGLKFFVKQGFGFAAGRNGVHRTSVSKKFYRIITNPHQIFMHP
jgi:hypothetical protein